MDEATEWLENEPWRRWSDGKSWRPWAWPPPQNQILDTPLSSDSGLNNHKALYFVKYPSRAIQNSPEYCMRPTGRGLKTPGLKHSRKAEMPLRTTPHGEQHSSTPFFPVGCWSLMNCAWVSGSQSMSQNCAPCSAQRYGLLQTCSPLDTRWNYRGSTMASLCSCTGLVLLVLNLKHYSEFTQRLILM